jgi:excisionase family DNA binding protein
MEIMTLKKAAEYLGLSTDVLRRKANDGSVPAAKLGSGSRAPWRFYREELDQLLNWNGAPVDAKLEKKHIFYETMAAYYVAEDEDTQIAVIQQISNLKDNQAIPFLCEILLNKENQPAIIVWAIKAMINILEIDPQKYQHELQEMLTENDDPHVRVLALRELRKIEFNGIAALIKPLFNDKDNRVKNMVINITGEKKLKILVPELQNIINSEAPQNLKKDAAIALTQIYSES